MPGFYAVIVADSPHARAVVLGLTLVERACRVAAKVGARNVVVASEGVKQRGAALLVIRASDQVVHMPLVEPLLHGREDVRIAIGPDGQYAGALWLSGAAADRAIEMLAAGASDRELVAAWPDAERIEHGPIARHAATTPAERKGAAQMLLGLLNKAEDGPVTKYIYRPVSRPLTRLLVNTPVTPNQVSLVVLALGVLGCWFTLRPDQTSLIIGAALVLIGGFVDGTDGELARLRLQGSKLGAWLDTVVDELTTVLYFLASGYHTYLHHPERWIVPSMVLGLCCYVAAIYGIYYFLVVVSKTGNSQHYVGDLEVADSDAGTVLRPRRRPPSSSPPWLQTLGGAMKHTVRRDFINLGALALTFVNAYFFIYGTMLLGGVVTFLIVIPEHVRLRSQLREVARRGATPRLLVP